MKIPKNLLNGVKTLSKLHLIGMLSLTAICFFRFCLTVWGFTARNPISTNLSAVFLEFSL